MKLRRRTIWRLSGLLGAGAFLGLYITAMSLDGSYVFGKNYLSDLGVSEGAWAFNSGLIISGLFFIVFSVLGLGRELGKDLPGRLGTALLIASALLLIGIGIFTEDAGEIHRVLSYAFFLETLVTIGVVDFCLWRTRSLGSFGPAVTSSCLIFGLVLLPFGGTPLVETLAVLAIVVWGVLISARLATKD